MITFLKLLKIQLHMLDQKFIVLHLSSVPLHVEVHACRVNVIMVLLRPLLQHNRQLGVKTQVLIPQRLHQLP